MEQSIDNDEEGSMLYTFRNAIKLTITNYF